MTSENKVEERIKALEITQVQFQKDLSQLVTKQTEIFNQQIMLDKTMSAVLAKLDARFDDEVQLEHTLRNLDDSVNTLALKLEGMPLEHNRSIVLATDKIWSSIRKQESKLQDFKDKAHIAHENIKTDVKTDIVGSAKNYTTVIATVLGICGILIGAMYFNLKEQVKSNSEHISKHHTIHVDKEKKHG